MNVLFFQSSKQKVKCIKMRLLFKFSGETKIRWIILLAWIRKFFTERKVI